MLHAKSGTRVTPFFTADLSDGTTAVCVPATSIQSREAGAVAGALNAVVQWAAQPQAHRTRDYPVIDEEEEGEIDEDTEWAYGDREEPMRVTRVSLSTDSLYTRPCVLHPVGTIVMPVDIGTVALMRATPMVDRRGPRAKPLIPLRRDGAPVVRVSGDAKELEALRTLAGHVIGSPLALRVYHSADGLGARGKLREGSAQTDGMAEYEGPGAGHHVAGCLVFALLHGYWSPYAYTVGRTTEGTTAIRLLASLTERPITRAPQRVFTPVRGTTWSCVGYAAV